MTTTCQTCHWYWRHAPSAEMGNCRRRAPVLAGVYRGDEIIDGWPSARNNDWCGDWQRNHAVSLDAEAAKEGGK